MELADVKDFCASRRHNLRDLPVTSTSYSIARKEVRRWQCGFLPGIEPKDLLPLGFRVAVCWGIVLTCMGAVAADRVEREARLAVEGMAHRINANDNASDVIVTEAVDTATLQRTAYSRGISQAAMEGISVVRCREGMAVSVRQTTGSADIFEAVRDELRWYVSERAGGHSRAFLCGCLTNQSWRPANPNKDLQYILARHPKLPTALLQRSLSGAYTNRLGSEAGREWLTINTNGEFREYDYTNYFKGNEIVAWTNYVLVDGELAWIYQVRNPPPEPYLETVGLADAKEFDPKFRDAILRVEKEAVSKLQKEGRQQPRRWQIDRVKKELLERQGIYWRSSADLAPHPQRDWKLLE